MTRKLPGGGVLGVVRPRDLSIAAGLCFERPRPGISKAGAKDNGYTVAAVKNKVICLSQNPRSRRGDKES